MGRPKSVPVTFRMRYGVYNAGETAGFDRALAQELCDRKIARPVTLEELRKKYPKEDVLQRVAVLKGGDEDKGKQRG